MTIRLLLVARALTPGKQQCSTPKCSTRIRKQTLRLKAKGRQHTWKHTWGNYICQEICFCTEAEHV